MSVANFVDEENPHLGGYIVGGDEATLFPDLWTWIADELEVRSVLDVGCGEGQALSHFRKTGRVVTGIDGIDQDDPDIVRWDYEDGPRDTLNTYDLCWSCEFVEHVEEKYAPNFLADFARCDALMMTHAAPGQFGHHHVNCRPADYWVGMMAGIGLALDPWLTEKTRALSTANRSPLNHWHRSGLVFRKNR